MSEGNGNEDNVLRHGPWYPLFPKEQWRDADGIALLEGGRSIVRTGSSSDKITGYAVQVIHVDDLKVLKERDSLEIRFVVSGQYAYLSYRGNYLVNWTVIESEKVE